MDGRDWCSAVRSEEEYGWRATTLSSSLALALSSSPFVTCRRRRSVLSRSRFRKIPANPTKLWAVMRRAFEFDAGCCRIASTPERRTRGRFSGKSAAADDDDVDDDDVAPLPPTSLLVRHPPPPTSSPPIPTPPSTTTPTHLRWGTPSRT